MVVAGAGETRQHQAGRVSTFLSSAASRPTTSVTTHPRQDPREGTQPETGAAPDSDAWAHDGPSDRELVAELRCGDDARVHAAFSQVVDRYGALVHAIAAGVTGDANGAHDVSQNVFIKVFRNIGDLSDPSKLKSWIGNISRTTSIDWMRRRKHLKVSLDDLRDQGAPIEAAEADASDAPPERIEAEERRRLVLAAIQELPDKYREVLTLKHLTGLSYQEINELLGISISAIESRLYRARAMLRGRLERLGLVDAKLP